MQTIVTIQFCVPIHFDLVSPMFLASQFCDVEGFCVFSAETAAEMPVLTFASGTTNSMRGAAFLTGPTNN